MNRQARLQACAISFALWGETVMLILYQMGKTHACSS